MKTVKIAVFASGRGTGFEAIAAAVAGGKLDAEIVALVTDQPKAPVIEKARKVGVKIVVIPWDELPRQKSPAERRALHEEKVLAELQAISPKFLVLAGYMRILTPKLIEAFRAGPGRHVRIVNIHPSLLPAFPGVDAYRQAFEHGCRVAGATVHLVELEVDAGPICAQRSFDISHCQSAEEVEKLGLAVEHELYPETLRWVLAEKFEMKSSSQGRPLVRVRPD
jgi:phosphoribosylglycinamide formyltransferase-1